MQGYARGGVDTNARSLSRLSAVTFRNARGSGLLAFQKPPRPARCAP